MKDLWPPRGIAQTEKGSTKEVYNLQGNVGLRRRGTATKKNVKTGKRIRP